ncbi:MAG: hypothetical protein ACLPN6_28795 [Streptosporangiaceae bacterium]
MHGTLLAVVNPDNTPHGYNWSFAFPMLLFIVITGALYLIFRRPHTVPGHHMLAAARAGGGQRTPTPEAGAAHAAAVSAGFTTAEGGGSGESEAEPLGAHRATAEDDGSGNVSARGATTAEASEPPGDTAPTDSDPEASE